MVVLGVGVAKEELLEIAKKANVEAKGTPASNVIRIPDSASKFVGFVMTSNKLGYELSRGQRGQLLVRRK